MIKIFNSVIGISEYVNHRLSTFVRIEIGIDTLNNLKAIRIYFTDGSIASVPYDSLVPAEDADFVTSLANIDAATL